MREANVAAHEWRFVDAARALEPLVARGADDETRALHRSLVDVARLEERAAADPSAMPAYVRAALDHNRPFYDAMTGIGSSRLQTCLTASPPDDAVERGLMLLSRDPATRAVINDIAVHVDVSVPTPDLAAWEPALEGAIADELLKIGIATAPDGTWSASLPLRLHREPGQLSDDTWALEGDLAVQHGDARAVEPRVGAAFAIVLNDVDAVMRLNAQRDTRTKRLAPLRRESHPRADPQSAPAHAVDVSVSCPPNGPRPVSAAAPHRAAKASASSTERRCASANVRPAAKESPQP